MSVFPVSAQADKNGVIVLSASDAGTSSQTRGWAFSIATPIDITSLGYFDNEGAGLSLAHQVGIWNQAGILLMSGTVNAGAVDPLIGGFRFTSALTGTTILSLGTYIVGGLSKTDDPDVRDLSTSDVVFGNEITYIEDRTNGTSNVFSAPLVTTGANIGYFGGNFRYNTVVIPESSTVALALPALGMIGAVVIKRRKK